MFSGIPSSSTPLRKSGANFMLVFSGAFHFCLLFANLHVAQVDRFLKDDQGHGHWVFEQNPVGPGGPGQRPISPLHNFSKGVELGNWLERFVILSTPNLMRDFVIYQRCCWRFCSQKLVVWSNNRRPIRSFSFGNQKSGLKWGLVGYVDPNQTCMIFYRKPNSGWQYRDWFLGSLELKGSWQKWQDVKIHVARGQKSISQQV